MSFNPFEQYGIKEVADVMFEALEDGPGYLVGDIVLYLDSLKVSTVEMTGEQAEARGGKGNPALIIWDYGREITLNLQDALFSAQSLQVMTGGVQKIAAAGDVVTVQRTRLVNALGDLPVGEYKWTDVTTGVRGRVPAVYNASLDTTVQAGKTYYTRTGSVGSYVYTAVASPTGNPSTSSYYELASGTGAPVAFPVRVFYNEVKDGTSGKEAYEISIGASSFPGTYKVTGDTFTRNRNNVDSGFQFVIPRAKMNSEVTFTMESEGDPSVFDMNLRVLKSDSGEMIKLIKY